MVVAVRALEVALGQRRTGRRTLDWDGLEALALGPTAISRAIWSKWLLA